MTNIFIIIVCMMAVYASCSEVWTVEQATETIIGHHRLPLGDSHEFRDRVVQEWKDHHIPEEHFVSSVRDKVAAYGQELNFKHWFLDNIGLYTRDVEKKYGNSHTIQLLLTFADYMSLETAKIKGMVTDQEVDGITKKLCTSFDDSDRFEKLYDVFNGAPEEFQSLHELLRYREDIFYLSSKYKCLCRFLPEGGFMHMAEYLALYAAGYNALPLPDLKGFTHTFEAHAGSYKGARRVFVHDVGHLCSLSQHNSERGYRDQEMLGRRIWQDIDSCKTVKEQHLKIFVYYHLIHENIICLFDEKSDRNVDMQFGVMSCRKDYHPYNKYFAKQGYIVNNDKLEQQWRDIFMGFKSLVSQD